jgi:small subunit ribosomal protein S16
MKLPSRPNSENCPMLPACKESGEFISLSKFSTHNMAVKIRLQRRGRTKAPFYHIVIADARAPRDGRFIEKIGTYNPLTVPATIELNRERALYWVMVGAQPTDTVNAILRFKGVNYAKHLQVGVNKGAITQEEADKKLAAWIESKESGITARREATTKAKEDKRKKIDGVAKVKVKPVEEAPAPVAEEASEVAEEAVVAAEETVATAEEVVAEAAAPAEEAAPAAEETPEA